MVRAGPTGKVIEVATKKKATRKKATPKSQGLASGERDRNQLGDVNFNYKAAPAKDRTEPRDSTHWATMLDTLHEKCGFGNKVITRDALRLLNKHNGYGLVAKDSLVRLR